MPTHVYAALLDAPPHGGEAQPSGVGVCGVIREFRNAPRDAEAQISQLQKDGTYADAPALILHALWWDSNGSGEEARYAMLPIQNGSLSQDSVELHALEEFAGDDEPANVVDTKFNPEILRHPAIVSS